jgi:RNA polymerase sigma-70 factor (ECF subfamily)
VSRDLLAERSSADPTRRPKVTPLTASDRELARRALAVGDSAAFALLHSRYSGTLRDLALRLAGTEAPADAAVKATWARAALLMGSFEWEAAIRSWLVGLLVNEIRAIGQSPSDTSEADTRQRLATVLRDALPHHLDTAELTAVVARMPRRYREVLELHDLQGLSHREIGKWLGIDVGTSKSQLQRARQWVRRALEAGAGRASPHESSACNPLTGCI